MAQTKVKLIANGVIVQGNLHASHGITTAHIGEGSNLYYTDARVSNYLSTNGYDTATNIIASITDSAPSTLDTLNELAAALGDDANFSTTVTNSIALKAPLASPSFTGTGTFTSATSYVLTVKSTDTDAADIFRVIADDDGAVFTVSKDASDNAEAYLYSGAGAANIELYGGTGNATFAGNISGVRGFFNSGSTNVVATFTSTDGTATLQCADPTGNVEFGALGNNFVVQPAGGVAQLTVGSSTSTFAGEVSLKSRLNLQRLSGGATTLIQFKNENGVDRAHIDFGGTNEELSFFAGAGSSEHMRITSAGNVGIGTTSPQHLLHLKSTISGPTGIIIENTNNAQSLDIDFWNNAGAAQGRIRYNEGAGSFDFFPNVGASSAMTMLYNSNVGIGTTNPGYTFTVNKSITNDWLALFGNTYNGAGNGVLIDAGNGSSGEILRLRDKDGNNKVHFLSNGNVGIGTTSPGTKLDVVGEISSSDDININNGKLVVNHTSAEVRIKSSSDTGESYINFSDPSDINPGQIYYGHNSNSMIFRTNDDSRMTIDSAGNLTLLNQTATNSRSIGITNSSGTTGWTFGNGVLSSTHQFVIYDNTAGSSRMLIDSSGNVGINTTSPSSELEVDGRVIVEKLEVARYSDSNAPAAVYVGRSANPIGQGGIFRLGAIESSSTVNKIDEPFLITYSSGHWGCQPMFFVEFTVTYYRGSYIKYWAQHEVSGSRLEIVEGPYGGQIISGGAPVSRTITQLCTNCHGGQPVYKCVWKWSNSGTYIKTSPVVSLVEGHGNARVYTSGSSSESAVDTLLGGASSPGPAYLLMGINNAQAAGFTGLQTQN